MSLDKGCQKPFSQVVALFMLCRLSVPGVQSVKDVTSRRSSRVPAIISIDPSEGQSGRSE